jgi:hypothetical protein
MPPEHKEAAQALTVETQVTNPAALPLTVAEAAALAETDGAAAVRSQAPTLRSFPSNLGGRRPFFP